jgi:Protein of unknown function (DUF3102)
MQPQDILPDPPTQANPTTAELAELIRADVEAIGRADGDKLRLAFAVGTKLHRAKDQVEDKKWLQWLRVNCALRARTAQDYMRLATDRAVIDTHNARSSAHENISSIEAALRFLRKRNGTANSAPRARVTAPSKTVPFTSLAWADASLEERRKCLDGTRPEDFLAAMPKSWIAPIEARVLRQAGLEQLVETLERKLRDKPTAREALKMLQRVLESPPKPASVRISREDSDLDIPPFLRREPVTAEVTA